MIFKQNLVYIIVLFISFTTTAQKVTLSGKVFDSNSNESLIGVTIYIESLQKGAVTNEYGYYSITVPTGEYKVIYDYIGFTTISETIKLKLVL